MNQQTACFGFVFSVVDSKNLLGWSVRAVGSSRGLRRFELKLPCWISFYLLPRLVATSWVSPTMQQFSCLKNRLTINQRHSYSKFTKGLLNRTAKEISRSCSAFIFRSAVLPNYVSCVFGFRKKGFEKVNKGLETTRYWCRNSATVVSVELRSHHIRPCIDVLCRLCRPCWPGLLNFQSVTKQHVLAACYICVRLPAARARVHRRFYEGRLFTRQYTVPVGQMYQKMLKCRISVIFEDFEGKQQHLVVIIYIAALFHSFLSQVFRWTTVACKHKLGSLIHLLLLSYLFIHFEDMAVHHKYKMSCFHECVGFTPKK